MTINGLEKVLQESCLWGSSWAGGDGVVPKRDGWTRLADALSPKAHRLGCTGGASLRQAMVGELCSFGGWAFISALEEKSWA